MWDSPPRQMQSPCYAGTAAGTAFGARLSPAAAGEHALPDNAWNQSAPVAASRGSSGFLSLLGARDVTPEMFEDVPAACDYLTGLGAAAAAAASNMGGGAAYALGSVDRYSAAGVPPARHETAISPLVYSGDSVVHGSSSVGVGCAPRYDHEVNGGSRSQQQGFGAPTAALLQQMIPSRVEIQSALGYSGSSFGAVSLPDAGSFGDYRSAAEFMSSHSNRHEQDIRALQGMGSSNSGSGAAIVATRRKSEERVGGNAKKSKQKASHKASPPKAKVPKVKLGEKITTLQQIVSPFGKTDTSSVLFETIKYIEFLHEQLRLFSEPYTTKTAHKGHIRFGGEVKEEKTGMGMGHGLRGRGLCLVPVSLTSQVLRDDIEPDCWTPAYRSCLYR